MKKAVICLSLALSFIAPVAHADAQTTPMIVIINETTTKLVPIDMKVLEDFLSNVQSDWGVIYSGPYIVYIVDDIPYNIINIKPHSAIALHTDATQIFVSLTEVLRNPYSIYTVITHELAETAIDPYLTNFDSNGNLIEICDPYIGVESVLDNQTVARYATPGFYNIVVAAPIPVFHMRWWMKYE